MNIVIVEDCKEHSNLIENYINNWSVTTGQKTSVSVFENGEQFLFHHEDTGYIDAIFLDIQMPGISGVELARKVRKENREIAIIFTTGIDDYIGEGYELEAIHYLMKPISLEKVSLCLDKVSQKMKKKEQYIALYNGEDVFKVAYSKLWWISAVGHHVMLGLEDDNGCVKRIDAKNSIGEIEKQLRSSEMFQRTHRSYIVNLAHVKSITKTDVIMDNQDKIPLSRRMYQQVNAGFIDFYTESGK